MSQADTMQPKRSILALSLGISLSAFAAIVAAILFSGASADAGTWVITASGGTYNWTSSTTPWTCTPVPTTCTGAYPGAAAAGDQVNLANCCNTVQINSAIPFALTTLSNITASTVDVLAGGSLVTNGGTVANGAILSINSGGGTLTNTGNLIVNAGGNLLLNGGTLQNNVANGIVLQGGAAAAAGTMTWQGGNLQGSGSTVIQPGVPNASLTIAGLSGPNLVTQQIINNGNINYAAGVTGSLQLNSNALITNNASFILSSDTGIGSADLTGRIVNSTGATFQKTGGVGQTPIVVFFDNAGVVSVPVSGLSIAFSGGGTQTGTFTFGPATSFAFDGNHIFNPGATFSGAGPVTITGGIFQVNTGLTIPGNLSNSGSLQFGGATTQGFSISGNYMQSATGALTSRLNGLVAGSQYDQVRVTGSAAVNGTLNATLGFTPAAGNIWDVITDASVAGDFVTKNLPAFAGGVVQEIPTPPTGTQVRLQAVALTDIAIGKTGPASVLDGQNATYTVTVANLGPSTPANVVITDTFSGGGASLLSASPSSGTCTVTGPTTFNCTFPAVAMGTPESVTVILKAGAPGTITNTANLFSSIPADSNPGNNSQTATTAVVAAADLAVNSVIGAPNPVNAGQSETWQVVIGNNGPDAATNVVVNLSFAGGGTMLSAGGGGFTCVIFPPASAQCTNPSMAAATSSTITVTSTAPNVAGVWTLNANLNSATADPNLANNSLSGSVNVAASADIGVIKTLSGSAVAGGNAVYNITVKNNGPSDATSVTVNDTPGPGLTFVSVSGSGCTSFPCTIASLSAGATTPITATYSVASGATGTVSNTATANSPNFDGTPGNNSSTTTNAVVIKADLSVTKTGPASALPGATVTYTIIVSNYGPSDATGVVLKDPPSAGLTLVSVSGSGCTGFPCTLGTMISGDICTVFATYTIQKGFTSVTNTATVTATTPDPNLGNNSATATTKVGCPTSAPINPFPPDGATNVATSGLLGWTNVGAATYRVYLGPPGSGCSTLLGSSNTSGITYTGLASATQYEWHVEAVTPSCSTLSSTCFKFTTGGCPSTPPTLVAPANGSTVTGSVTFSWTGVAGAVDYKVFAGVNGATPTEVGTTTATTLTTSIDSGSVSWYVVAEFASPCPPVQSPPSSFNACGTSAPIPKLVSEVFTNQTYTFEWTAVNGATRYEVDEALDVNFAQGLSTQTVNGTSVQFQHTVAAPTPFFYRVRAFVSCSNGFGPNSQTMRIVLALIPPPDQPNPNINVPTGSTRVVVQIIHVPGFSDGTFPFVATVDKPWLQVTPPSGLLPPEGIDLTVTADPTNLPNGTQTGTVLVNIGSSAGAIRTNGTTTVSVPVSISLVTPVTPTKPVGEPPANALIIPAAGHLDGINSRWQSDVTLTNIAASGTQYELTFTPDDPSKGVKQTIITAGAQSTIALSDIVRNWYGVGSLGETANGVLMIRPLSGSGKVGSDQVNISLTTVAASRTYNVTSNGTLGEYIPAIPFANFIGRVTDPNKLAPILGLQQIMQSDNFRTNLGLVEAAGKPVSVLASVFDPSGRKVLDLPVDLKANEQKQLNSFLAQNRIALANGRIEVKVTGGDGKITAYASVVDNRSGDPYLVSPVTLSQTSADTYVLPGVADVNTGLAAWRTDMTIFNSGSVPQLATLTFYPQGNPTTPRSTSMTVNPGELKVLDNVLPSFLGTTNAGGAVHVTTPIPSSMVVSGHTYDLTTNGTKGQFIQAVTPSDAAGRGDRDLQILQVEDSVRYYTNIGIAEVTGNPVTVEVAVVLPDSKISPKTQIPLAANGFFQQDVIQALGLSNVYNARVSVRVLDGNGKITAYGSVIDQKTKDATYVPAQ